MNPSKIETISASRGFALPQRGSGLFHGWPSLWSTRRWPPAVLRYAGEDPGSGNRFRPPGGPDSAGFPPAVGYAPGPGGFACSSTAISTMGLVTKSNAPSRSAATASCRTPAPGNHNHGNTVQLTAIAANTSSRPCAACAGPAARHRGSSHGTRMSPSRPSPA